MTVALRYPELTLRSLDATWDRDYTQMQLCGPDGELAAPALPPRARHHALAIMPLTLSFSAHSHPPCATVSPRA